MCYLVFVTNNVAWCIFQFLTTWKSKTKSKARNVKIDQTGTGGGPAASSSLTDFEQRLMLLVGWNTVDGCDSVAQELIPGQKDIVIEVEEGLLNDLNMDENNINNISKL